MLRRLRRRSLAALRQELEPVPPAALATFLPQWQHLGSNSLRGIDGLVRAIEQLQGAPVPASALEKLVLPSRVGDYTPATARRADRRRRGGLGRGGRAARQGRLGLPLSRRRRAAAPARRRTPWS